MSDQVPNDETRKEYSDEMRGTLWKNEGELKDKAPNYTGMAVISGVKVRIAMWGPSVAPKSGKKYLSLKLEYPQGATRFLVPVAPADVRVKSGIAVAETTAGDAGANPNDVGDMPF